MVEHVCEKCEKVFKQKSQLDAHKNRKNPCKKDGAIEKIVEKKVEEQIPKILPAMKFDVFTPTEISIKMASYFTRPIQRLLEPSVGTGNLLNAMDGKYEIAHVYDINENYLSSLPLRPNIVRHHMNFMEIGVDETYDGIILNPPYQRFQDMDVQMRKTVQDLSPILASGNTDLYIGFLYKCIQHLSPSGTLVAIVPNSWLYNASSAPFRAYLHSNRLIREIHDYGSEKVFKGVNVYCCILVLDRAEKTEYSQNGVSVPYTVKSNSDTQRTLGQHVKMRNGVATLCDAVFIRDTPIDNEPCWKPIYKVSKDQERHIIYPYDGDGRILSEDVFREANPRTYEFLVGKKEDLAKRDKGNKTYEAWYAWGRRQGLMTPTTCDSCVYISTMVSAECPTTVKRPMLFYSGLQIVPTTSLSASEVQECIAKNKDEISRNSSKRGSGWLNISTRVLAALPV